MSCRSADPAYDRRKQETSLGHHHSRTVVGNDCRRSGQGPESAIVKRRALVKTMGLTGNIALADAAAIRRTGRCQSSTRDRALNPHPAQRNEAYTIERDFTPEEINASVQQLLRFRRAQTDMEGGPCAADRSVRHHHRRTGAEAGFTIGFEDLLGRMGLEERFARHRCLEAWSMTAPWSGFPLADLLSLAKPLSSARFVRSEAFLDPIDRDRPESALVSVALYRRREHGRGRQRSAVSWSPTLTFKAMRDGRSARRSGWPCRGSTASSTSSRSSASASPKSRL